MSLIKLKIQNFETNLFLPCDIICTEKIQFKNVPVACTYTKIKYGNDEITIKFEWIESFEKLSEDNFYFVEETGMLFFTSMEQWGVIDPKNRMIIRHEAVCCYPIIIRKKSCIIIEEELSAESVTLNGIQIDRVLIDPPSEVTEFEDRIEYNSIVFGHQVLKII